MRLILSILALAIVATMAVEQGVVGKEKAKSFIAGAQPDRRPESAPKIRHFEKPADWYDQALKGIKQPYPYSLKFLEDQGSWYTPFNRPNTTGPYDIRGLYQKEE